MRTTFFIILLPIVQLYSQYAQLGAELYSREEFKYGKFEALIHSSDRKQLTTSFFLYSNQKDLISTLGVDINPDSTICTFLDHNNLQEFKTQAAASPHVYTIEWTPKSLRWLIDSIVVYEAKPSGEALSAPMRVFLNIWKDTHTSEATTPDTTLSEIDVFRYYEYIEKDTTPTFALKYEDHFNKHNSAYWVKSTQQYPENVLRNDTSLVYYDQGKLQLISLTYKTKNFKGIFKRDSKPESIKEILKYSYSNPHNKPTITLVFADTIYNADKNIRNFEISDQKITKSKLKSDYKTVLLTLEKPISGKSILKYTPLVGRFRKPQIMELEGN